MLENTEGAIKKEQPRDTVNCSYKPHFQVPLTGLYFKQYLFHHASVSAFVFRSIKWRKIKKTKQPHSEQWKNRRNRGKSIPQQHICMTAHFSGLVQALQWKSGGVKLVILHAYIFHSKHQTVIQLINIWSIRKYQNN